MPGFVKGKNLSLFQLTFFSIILIELFSLCAYLYPLFNKITFLTILIAVAILTWKKLEYGLYFVIAELIISSKGYLFSWEIGGGKIISIRMGLFVVIMGIWTIKILKHKNIKVLKQFYNYPLFYPYLFLGLTIVYGIIFGILKGNNLTNIFLDANGWLYFLLIFPKLYVFYKNDNAQTNCNLSLRDIVFAALAALIFKTFFILFVFSHKMFYIMPNLYRWIRTTGVGEITDLENFYRVFFQSHIFALLGFFVLLPLVIYKNTPQSVSIKQKKYSTLFLAGLASLIIISFSRSFWLAFVATFVFYFIYLFFKKKFKLAIKTFIFTIFVFLTGTFFVIAAINFPYPKASGISFTDALGQRGKTNKEEAALGSRWNLLPVLGSEIKKSPIFGFGFGKTITYNTKDPRALENNPDGKYKTFAFEWGWLDFWLKMGIFGVLAYIYLLFQILKIYWQNFQGNKNPLHLGLILGIIALAITHFFTPYLNHPLGIGYIIFMSLLI